MQKYTYVRRTLTWDGVRYEVKGRTEAEAVRKLTELRESLRRGERTMGEKSTVDRWFEDWYELYKVPSGVTEKTLKMYRGLYDRYLRPRIGRMRLRDVREIHLQRILNAQAGRSFSHVSKLRLLMRELFGKARSTRLLVWNPAEGLVLPETTKGTHRPITDEERAHILAVAKDHPSGLWVLTILYTGMRPGETAPLLWRDVDFEKNEISVTKALQGGSRAVVKAPKTPAGVRYLPIHRELLPALLAARGAPDELVFPTRGGKMRDSKALGRLWSSFKRALDISMGARLYRNRIIESVVAEDLTPYCLRHTYCSDLQRAGIPINVAKELMGHSDISMTANIYTHRNQEVLHESVARLADSQVIVTSTSGSGEVFLFAMVDDLPRGSVSRRGGCFSHGEASPGVAIGVANF